MRKNNKVTDGQLKQIADLFSLGYSGRKIANITGISVSHTQRLILELGLRPKKAVVDRAGVKQCKNCEEIFSLDNFRKHDRIYSSGNIGVWYSAPCNDCERKYNQELNASPESKATRRKYRENNKEKENARLKKKRDEDIGFRLRRIVSVAVYRGLKASGSQKDASCMEYLPFTIEELKAYLESLFEPWMKWENYGAYVSSTWDDSDQSTWVWNIDHIIPQSTLSYASMEDENFNKCWSLSNLRPYSAKLNAWEGGNKTRHKAA